MRSATSIALIALLASPALAHPLSGSAGSARGLSLSKPSTAAPKPASSSGSGIGAAVAGGAASAAVSNLLNKIESLFRREELDGVSARDIKSTIDSLSPADKATVKAALVNKISTLKDSDLAARGVAGSIGGAVAGGAASAVVGNLLSEIESLFRREDEELARRGLSLSKPSSSGSTGSGIAAAAAGGAASGLVGNLLNEIESLFRRGAPVEEEPPAPAEEEPSTGSQIAAAAAGGAASGAVSNLLNKIESLFRREELDGVSARDIKSTIDSLSPADKATVKAALVNKISTLKDSDLAARGVAGSIGGAVAGGAASAVVGNLLSEIESLFRREDEELARRGLSLSKPTTAAPKTSTGSGIGAAVAGGAASAAVGNLLSKIESLFRREEDGIYARDIKSTIASLSPADQATVKAALINKISTLKDSDLAARGVGVQLGSAAAGGAASAVVGHLLTEIEKLFRRGAPVEEEPPAPAEEEPSTGSQIAAAAAGGAASGAVGNILNKIESFFGFKRGEFDIKVARRDLASIAKQIPNLSPADKQTVKTALINKISTLQNSNTARGLSLSKPSSSGSTGSGIAAAAAGGAASGLVGNLLNEIESLFRRDAEMARRGLIGSAAGSAASGLTSVATNTVVGDLLNKIESLFRREELTARDFKSTIASLSPEDQATVKAALVNKISTLKDSDLSARGIFGNGIGGAVAGGAASGAVGNLLSKIEELFRREELAARSEEWNINQLD